MTKKESPCSRGIHKKASAVGRRMRVLLLLLSLTSAAGCAPTKSVVATAKIGAALETHREALSQVQHYCGYLHPFSEALKQDAETAPSEQEKACQNIARDQLLWVELHKAILVYSKHLQELAEAKGADVGDEVKSLLAGTATLSKNKPLKDAADPFGKAVQGLVNAVLESYRQKKLVEVIKQTDPQLQKAVEALREVIVLQVANLGTLNKHVVDKVRDLNAGQDLGESGDAAYDAVMISLYQTIVWAEHQRKILGSYDAALLAFAKAHGALYDGVQKGLSLKNAMVMVNVLGGISTAMAQSAKAFDALSDDAEDEKTP